MANCCLCERHPLEVPPHPTLPNCPRVALVPITQKGQEKLFNICRVCAQSIGFTFARETTKKPPRKPRSNHGKAVA